MRKILLLICSMYLLAAASGADYLFPSANPPGGKKPADVKQYVVFTFDDNSYSGKRGTQYECIPGGDYKNSSWVGGVIKEGGWVGTKPNSFNIQEGDMGVSWAAVKLAGHIPIWYPKWDSTVQYTLTKDTVVYNDSIWFASQWPPIGSKPQIYPDTTNQWSRFWKLVKPVDHTLTRKNPDGSPLHFNFNVISGLFVPVWPTDWTNRESKLGYWKPTALDYPDGNILHQKIAVAWGREQLILETANGKTFQQNYIQEAFQDARDFGHEIGNHTIDHMESNSPVPNNSLGFGKWGGEGFDKYPFDTMPWGEVIDEAKVFGQKVGASAQTMGWLINSGYFLGKNGWKGSIALAEEQLNEYLGLSVVKGTVHAFRAPRLEIGSGCFYGLKELGYQYDCSLEEGYEPNVSGHNQLWPYTMDNGSPGQAYQRMTGERIHIDSTPAGLWEFPCNAVVVPSEIRQQVYNNYATIAKAAPDGGTPETFDEWVSNGAKVTSLDFNMFILWGMTKANWLATMKYNLDQRLANNKAPFQYGCHTDYYTPIYDYATLLSDFNKSSYGLNVTNGWNTWKDRIAAMGEFADYALQKGCYFVTGHELIEACRKMQSEEQFGNQGTMGTVTWKFFRNAAINSSAVPDSVTGDITNAAVTLGPISGGEYPNAGFETYKTAGYFKGMTHIELTYKTTVPLKLRMVMASDKPWEVIVSNVGPEVGSGRIPMTAFHYDLEDSTGTNTAINTADIIGIQIELYAAGTKSISATLSIKDLKLYGAAGSIVPIGNSIPARLGRDISVHSFTRSSLGLSVAAAGAYTIQVVSLQGRVVASYTNIRLNQGMTFLNLNNCSRGIYCVTIKNGIELMSVKRLQM